MIEDSPIAPAPRQSFLRRFLRVLWAALQVFGRGETWQRIFRAVDFLLSNEIYTYASAVAFNAIIAFFPAAIVILTLAHELGGPPVRDLMLSIIADYLPANRVFFTAQIAAVTANFGGMTLFSLAILLFSAVGIFIPIELALNFVWNERVPRHWFVSQLLSFLLLAICVCLAIMPVFLSWWFSLATSEILFFLKGTFVLDWLNWIFQKLVTIPFTIIAFAAILFILPKKRLRLEEILPAAIFSGIVIEIGRQIYVLVLPLLKLGEIYGAFAVSVTFITWALFASMVMLMGAWLTAQNLMPTWRRNRLENGIQS
jgi:membrane protein/epoxyqueuosine reductase